MLKLPWKWIRPGERLTSSEKWEQDKNVVRHVLWVMPLLSIKEMAAVIALSEHRCWLLLDQLMEEKQVRRAALNRRAALGGRRVARYRYWLSTRAVREMARAKRGPLPWQVTASGLRWLVRRLPMVEAFYALAPGLWSHPGMDIARPVVAEPGPFEELIRIDPDHKSVTFRWVRRGQIHAIVQYQHGIWVCMVWVGSMVTEHKLKERGAQAVAELGDKCQPAGWVIVGHDRLVAWQGGKFWPAENVMAVDVNGRVERRMRPGDFDYAPDEPAVAARLGDPDKLVGWLDKKCKDHNKAMVALNTLSRVN